MRAEPLIPRRLTATILVPFSLMLLVSVWPWPSLPATGLDGTLNLLIWLGCALWGLCLLPFLWESRYRNALPVSLLIGGAVLMSLPWLWTPADFRNSAIYRLAGLWAIALLMVTLLQIPIRGGVRRWGYGLVMMAGVVQALISFWQLIWPKTAGLLMGFNPALTGGRLTGTLLQANVLGSLVATALLCAVILFFSLRHRARRYLMLAAILLLAAAVTASQSRTALYVALPAATGIILLLSNHRRIASLAVVIALLAGLTAGQGILSLRPAPAASPASGTHAETAQARLSRDRLSSDTERLALIRGAVALIARAPVEGAGLGTFERRFPEILAENGQINPFPVTVGHPHNELLYVWSEGGITALAGLLLWLIVWGLPFLRWRKVVVARVLLTVPVIAHCMTEMPLYLSTLHAVVLVMLLRLALPARSISHSGRFPRPVTLGLTGLCLASALFMVTGLHSASHLLDAERFRLLDPAPLAHISNPYAQADRLLFDRAVNNLMMFGLLQDQDYAARFSAEATQWLSLHNDPRLTASLMQLAQLQGDRRRAEYWRQRGCQSFYQDKRFRCPSPILLSRQETSQ